MTYAEAVLSTGPAGYWKLDEPSGTAILDSSGNGKHGTWVTPPVQGALSLLPNEPTVTSCDFTTPPMYGVVPGDPLFYPSRDFSYSHIYQNWAKQVTDGQRHWCFTIGGSDGTTNVLPSFTAECHYHPGWNANTNGANPFEIGDNNWAGNDARPYHYIVVAPFGSSVWPTQGVAQAWMNGSYAPGADSVNVYTTAPADTRPPADIWIGKSRDPNVLAAAKGRLAQVIWWNRCLTREEITMLTYASGYGNMHLHEFNSNTITTPQVRSRW